MDQKTLKRANEIVAEIKEYEKSITGSHDLRMSNPDWSMGVHSASGDCARLHGVQLRGVILDLVESDARRKIAELTAEMESL